VTERALEGIDLRLVDSLVVPASVHDVEGHFLHMNAAAERASGRSAEEVRGGHYTDSLPPEARPHVVAQFSRAVERGEPTDFETVFVDAGGNVRGVRAQHLPLRVDGEIVGVLILAFDVRRPGPPTLAPLPPLVRLTPRQREVLDLMAAGFSTAEIAKELTLSPETVRNHLRGLFVALQVHSRPEALAAAQRLGLLAVPVLGPLPSDTT
jgi:PAS domain S-box-containing protein